jgi:hypothetical protein
VPKSKPKFQASEEPKPESTDEDFELHGKSKPKFQASEDAPETEGEGEDFELHRKTHKAL